MYIQRLLFKYFIIVLVIALESNSCSKTEKLLDPLLEVSKTKLEFNNQDSKNSITIRSDKIINASTDQSWCSVVTGVPVKSVEGFLSTELIVIVDVNNKTEERA